MVKHEEKICPRCKSTFECKVGSVSLCQCSGVKVSEAERNYLHQCFHDCLCARCMNEARAEFHNEQLKQAVKKLMRE